MAPHMRESLRLGRYCIEALATVFDGTWSRVGLNQHTAARFWIPEHLVCLINHDNILNFTTFAV